LSLDIATVPDNPDVIRYIFYSIYIFLNLHFSSWSSWFPKFFKPWYPAPKIFP